MRALSLPPRVLVILALALTAACENEVAPPAAMVPAVSVVTLQEQSVVLTRQLPGRTSPYVVAEVRPQVTGIVTERLFEEGGEVTAGQVLYQLDDATYRANYNSAEASRARAEASLEFARLNAKRSGELVKAQTVSQQEYERAMSEWREAEADVSVAKARIASARVELDFASITSPIDGRIGKSAVTKGALVTADQATALTIVQQLDPIYVDLSQSSAELLEMRRELENGSTRRADKLPVSILLEDGSTFPEKGELAFSDVAVNQTTGSVSLRVVVPNPDQLLLPGMYVRAVLSTGVLDRAVLVPQQGIVRNPQGDAVAMLVSDDGTVESRVVKVSRTIGTSWLVTSGLAAGDRVIVEGLQKIRPGATVDATEVPSDTPDAGSGNPGITGGDRSGSEDATSSNQPG